MPKLSAELLKQYKQDGLQTVQMKRNLDNDTTCIVIDNREKDTTPTLFTRLSLYFMFSPRVFLDTYYDREDAITGTYETLSSSVMNESIRDEL